jgi:hypothetical protein
MVKDYKLLGYLVVFLQFLKCYVAEYLEHYFFSVIITRLKGTGAFSKPAGTVFD